MTVRLAITVWALLAGCASVRTPVPADSPLGRALDLDVGESREVLLFGLKPGDPVTFKVRTFRTPQGQETWTFGDGTPPVAVTSDGNVKPLAADGYAETTHSFAKAGLHVVTVERSGARGMQAVAHLKVAVGVD